MRALSFKLALLVLLLPISTVVILDIITYLTYRTLIIGASDILSSILVLLLVWERLRESLSKKLDYFHKDYMGLSSAYKQNFFWYHNWQNDVKRIGADLKRHGKFLIFSVYPTSLNEIDKLVSDFDKIEDGLKTVDKIAERSFGPYEKDVWYHLLGIMELEQESLKAPTRMQALNSYQQTAKIVKEEQAELLNRLKHLIEATDRMKKKLLGELEEFLKSNDLPLEPRYDRSF